MSFASVDLPAPVDPTSAIVWPAGMSRSNRGRMTLPFVYANSTASNCTRPSAFHRSTGFTGSGTLGRSSSTPEIFSSADDADWYPL